jgi:quinol monooxygenase YgiN
MDYTQLKEKIKNSNSELLYGRSGRIRAKDGESELLFLLLSEASGKMQAMQGNLLYLVNRESENKDIINFFELWETREHHNASMANREIMVLFAKALLLAEAADVDQM